MDEYKAIYFYCLILIAVLSLVFLILQVYISYFKFEEMMAYLGRSKLVSSRSRFFGKDFLGRMVIVNTIAGIISFPETHVKGGVVTREELDKVPDRIKFQMRLWVFFLSGMGVCGVALWVAGKLLGV